LEFIREFIEIRKGDGLHEPFKVDLDIMTKWLDTRKDKLKETLMTSYKEDIDYIVLLHPEVEQRTGKGDGLHEPFKVDLETMAK